MHTVPSQVTIGDMHLYNSDGFVIVGFLPILVVFCLNKDEYFGFLIVENLASPLRSLQTHIGDGPCNCNGISYFRYC